MMGVPSNHQRLMLEGRQLEDNRTISFYDIKDKAQLQLVLKSQSELDLEARLLQEQKDLEARLIQVHVKTLKSNEVIDLKVDPLGTIENVKAKIHEIKGIPPKWQMLTFNGQELEDGKHLSYYSIERESTLQLDKGMELIVKTQSGKPIILEVDPITDTLEKVKYKIKVL